MKDKFFLALLETSAAHADKSRAGFQRLDLPEGQPKVLYILYYCEGCFQKDLAERCRIRQSTLTVMLEKLEGKGYIRKERTVVSGGKRAYNIYLTEAGRKMAEQVIALIEDLEEQSMKGFSRKERELLLSMLERVTDNLNSSLR